MINAQVSAGAALQLEINRSFGWFLLLVVGLASQALGWHRGICAGILLAASVLVHEIGHFVVAKALRVRVKRLGVCYKGGYLVREMAPTRVMEALITLAGPGANFLLYALALMVPSKLVWWVGIMNLILALVNLLPLGPSDGTRLLRLWTRGFRNQVPAAQSS